MPPFIPLFDQESGGPASAWKCLAPDRQFNHLPCSRITRTKRGMIAHLWMVHGLHLQMSFNDLGNDSNNSSTLSTTATTKKEDV